MTDDLAVFQLGNDLVIAKSSADAIVVWQEQTGEDFEDYYANHDIWRAPRTITITFIEHGSKGYTEIPPDAVVKTLPDGGFTVKASAKDWAECYGRGILAGEDV